MIFAETDFSSQNLSQIKKCGHLKSTTQLIKILSDRLQNNRRYFNQCETKKCEKEYFSILSDLKLKDSVD